MNVIDVGCARWGGEYSLERLVEELQPDRLFGFDPAGDGGYGYGETSVAGVPCLISPKAAWVHDAEVPFRINGSTGGVHDSGAKVPCIDLARFVAELGGPVVVKIDAEGAEYPLLNHLIRRGTDALLTFAWVEWHPAYDPGRAGEALIRRDIGCPIKDWTW